MVRDVQPPPIPDSCGPDPIAQNVQLGAKLRMNSTPTLVFGSGVRMAGALAAAQLDRLLDGVSAHAAAAARAAAPEHPLPHR
jgi:thiol:disulfide interchange protein DsbC